MEFKANKYRVNDMGSMPSSPATDQTCCSSTVFRTRAPPGVIRFRRSAAAGLSELDTDLQGGRPWGLNSFWVARSWSLPSLLRLARAVVARQTHEAEIDQYMAVIDKLPLPAEEIQAITSRLRPWAEADDGKPVYMFNLIHFFPEVRTFPGPRNSKERQQKPMLTMRRASHGSG